MAKREKIMAGITCMILAGFIGGVGFVLYSTQNNMGHNLDKIAQLEEDLSESNQRAEKAEEENEKLEAKIEKLNTRLSKAKVNYEKCNDRLIDARAEIEILKNGSSESSSSSVETATTPEPTPVCVTTPESQETILPNDICDFDYTGTYSDGVKTVTISHADPGNTGMDASQTYIIKIKDNTPGAHGMQMIDVTGSIYLDGCSLICNGRMSYDSGGGFQDIGQASGVISHKGDQIYYYSDGVDNGPYTRVG